MQAEIGLQGKFRRDATLCGFILLEKGRWRHREDGFPIEGGTVFAGEGAEPFHLLTQEPLMRRRWCDL